MCFYSISILVYLHECASQRVIEWVSKQASERAGVWVSLCVNVCYWYTTNDKHSYGRVHFVCSFSLSLPFSVLFFFLSFFICLYVWMRACEAYTIHICAHAYVRYTFACMWTLVCVRVCLYVCCGAKSGYLICLALTNNSRHMHTECNGRILLFVAYFVWVFEFLSFIFLHISCVRVCMDFLFIARVSQVDPFVFSHHSVFPVCVIHRS